VARQETELADQPTTISSLHNEPCGSEKQYATHMTSFSQPTLLSQSPPLWLLNLPRVIQHAHDLDAPHAKKHTPGTTRFGTHEQLIGYLPQAISEVTLNRQLDRTTVADVDSVSATDGRPTTVQGPRQADEPDCRATDDLQATRHPRQLDCAHKRNDPETQLSRVMFASRSPMSDVTLQRTALRIGNQTS
jgi:hypothetical protein